MSSVTENKLLVITKTRTLKLSLDKHFFSFTADNDWQMAMLCVRFTFMPRYIVWLTSHAILTVLKARECEHVHLP